MNQHSVPVLLIHGLWDTPRIFNKFIEETKPSNTVYRPHLPHKLGRTSIYRLAGELDEYILNNLPHDQPLNIMGFSMGGIIARVWIQLFNGHRRTNTFVSIGSPHKGTITAQLIPPILFRGIADMKKGSNLLKLLNYDLASLKYISCTSFYCKYDLMVIPGWQAVAPVGKAVSVPVLTHKQLITSPKAFKLYSEKLFT